MTIIFLLIVISMAVALGFLAAYFWAQKDGQFDDDYSPAVRILFEDTSPAETTANPEKSSKTQNS